MKRILVVLLALLAPRLAVADDAAKRPRNAIPEHRLGVVDSEAPRSNFDESFQPKTEPEWDFPRKHLEQGRTFADPFLGTELFPEISAGTRILAAHDRTARGAIAFSNRVDLSLYFLDLHLPLHSGIDTRESRDGNDRVQVDLKIPFAIPGRERHRLALVWGNGIATDGQLSNVRYEVVYGYGGESLGLQARASYRLDQLGDAADRTLALGYGAVLSWRLGAFLPMVELDGLREAAGRTGDRITILPGVRIFPDKRDTLQLGLSALIGLAGDGQALSGARYGGVFDLSYNFL